MNRERTSVLIVGGGGAGLTASMLLSLQGVDTQLVSASPSTSMLPKAHVLNQRAMEILKDCGVADAIYAIGTPPEQFSHTAYYAGFAGSDFAGRIIYKQESWGAGGKDDEWRMASPMVASNLPQIRLEPILKSRAEELASGRVHFHQEVLDVQQHSDYIEATVLNHATGEERIIEAAYLLACDGGRTIGRRVGIELQGRRDLARTVSLYVSADFTKWAGDPDVLLRWIWSPETGQMIVMAPMGPHKWGGDSEEWVIHTSYSMDDDRAFDDDAVISDVRHALGIDDHPLQVHLVTRWTIGGVVANTFRSRRILVAGDAAHRHPPTGALGLTSAIHDVHNVCWKLAMVVHGHAGDSLLDSYDEERRPVDARNVQRSLENSRGHADIGKIMGFTDGSLTPLERGKILGRFFSDEQSDVEFRRDVVQKMAQQSQEFREHDVEYGYAHSSSAVVSDSVSASINSEFRVYRPSTIPGAPLPHAWIEDWKMNRISTLDLVPSDGFVVLCGEEGQQWCDAAHRVSEKLGVRIDAFTIGHGTGDFHDVRLRWSQVRAISPRGAILVRPDRCVGFRSLDAVEDVDTTLLVAMQKILSL